MNRTTLIKLALLLVCSRSWALGELFELYTAPQALGLGKAYTADATGHQALFHNPAALAKATARTWEIVPLALDGVTAFSSLGHALSAKSFGVLELAKQLKANPGSYDYLRANLLPAVSRRGFGFAIIDSFQYGGKSDGTSLDVNMSQDIGLVAGGALNFAGNLVKVGVTGKALIRNQLKGVFDHATLAGDSQLKSLMKEGLGFGGDLGLLFTLPYRYAPTLGITWRDMFNTGFTPTHTLNHLANGSPEAIKQSIHAALSVRPVLGKGIKSKFSAEFGHIERGELPLKKKLHFGVEIETDKNFFVWMGLNQLYLTAGAALRLKGGDFELGTYGEDVGEGGVSSESRRLFFRYTIGF